MIPRHFHFVFGLRKQTEPFHLVHYLCLESCRRVNRPETIRFHYHHEPHGPYWDLIKPHLDLDRVEPNDLVRSFRYRNGNLRPFRYAHHSDFIRLEKLIEEGGVYADIDTLFVNPLPPHLYEKPFVMGSEGTIMNPNTGRSEASLCNAMIMARPRAAFGRKWLDRMAAAFDGTWSNHSTLLPRRLADEDPESIHVEPQSSFYHFPATQAGISALLCEDRTIPLEVLSIHLWAHLWWSRRRTDFSTFHEGLITEESVREAATTFNRAARSFLPPDTGTRPNRSATRLRRWRNAAVARFTETSDDAWALAGLVAIPAIRTVSPGFGRLNLARARWIHRNANRRFRPRNVVEESILRSVIGWDEYDVFDLRFKSGDVVLDVGAHIGSFTYACHAMGCRNIQAFEPFLEIFSRLTGCVGGLPGVHCHRRAVVRSDRPPECLLHSGLNRENTASGNVIFGGKSFNDDTNELSENWTTVSTVATIALDEVLSRFERVRLMKMDCEGSEYPILLTSKLLERVERIVGEYHVIPKERMEMLTPEARVEGVDTYSGETLVDCLRASGHRVSIRPTSSGHGIFDAVKEG